MHRYIITRHLSCLNWQGIIFFCFKERERVFKISNLFQPECELECHLNISKIMSMYATCTKNKTVYYIPYSENL